MIILAVLGLVLLIYFGTNSDVNVDVKISNEKKQELVEDSSYTISGKKICINRRSLSRLEINTSN